MPKNCVRFAPNIPVHQLALESGDGEQVAPDLYVYDLVDGRQMYIPTALAVELRRAEIRPGESFSVCWRWNGDRATVGQWDVWLTGSAERQRAVEEAEDPEGLAAALQRSIDALANKKRMNAEKTPAPTAPPRLAAPSKPEEQPPHPALSVVETKTPRRPVSSERIPLDEAVEELLVIVDRALEKSRERWSDAARQDLLSTLIIQAGKEGWLARWKRPEIPARIA